MSLAPPELSALQKAWLQEMGIDARMLAHFKADTPFAASEPEHAPQQTRSAAEPAPVASQPEPREGLRPVAELLRRAPAPREPQPAPAPASPGAPLPDRESNLAALREHVAACAACGLNEVRSRTVFGDGAENAPRWMFVGEAPGEYDESVGRPFQGRAGELLQAMLEAAGMADERQLYFTNVLKCRPMGNRSPEANEISACLPILRREISLVRPGCLVALGKVSATALLGREEEFESLRGQVHEFIDDEGRRIPLVVTHHPAALLLHAQYKAESWRDLVLMSQLGVSGAQAASGDN